MEKKEIIIGTDEMGGDVNPNLEADSRNPRSPFYWEKSSNRPTHRALEGEENGDGAVEEEEVTEAVPIADMELHMRRIRMTVLMASPVPPPPGLMFQNAEIAASEVERIQRLDDLLDTVLYWATEECSTFLSEPSQLAQVEVPEVIAWCLLSQRPKVIQKALNITECLLQHPQTASELHRAVREYATYYQAQGKIVLGTDSSLGSSLFRVMVDLLEHFEGLPYLVAAAIRVTAQLMGKEGSKVLLESLVVGRILSAMVSHMENTSVHVASMTFFATAVSLPVAEDEEGAAKPGTLELHLPLSILFCHAEELLPLVLQVWQCGWSNLDIKRQCLHFIGVCSRRPENRLPLLQSHGFRLVMRALPELRYSEPELLVEALEIVSFAVPFLDSFQLRGVLRPLRSILQQRGEVEVLFWAVSVTYVVMRTLTKQRAAREEQKKTHSSDGENQKTHCSGEGEAHTTIIRPGDGREMRLTWSPLLEHPVPVADTIEFMHELCFPQLLIHLADFYAPRTSMHDDEAEPNTEEIQLHQVASRCVKELLRPHGVHGLAPQPGTTKDLLKDVSSIPESKDLFWYA